MDFDFIVVGSGISGAHAAQTLVEKNLKVLMLDVGYKPNHYNDIIPDEDFESIRKNDDEQHRYFSGDNFEGIPWENLKTGSQLTPPRKFLVEGVEKWLKLDSETFKPMESLAYGGLGGGWGAGCYVFSEKEIEAVGLDYSEMIKAYNVVGDRVGISCSKNDGEKYSLNGLKNVMKPIKIDDNMQKVLDKYNKKKEYFNSKGFFMDQPPLAILTEDRVNRKKYDYKDMEFWTDQNKAVYKSWFTIDDLRKKSNFSYQDKCYVYKFEEHDDKVEVKVKMIDTNEEKSFFCKKLILSPGVLGSARIVSRSFNNKADKLPLLCNPYYYVPSINIKELGKPIPQFKVGTGQLVLYYDETMQNMDVSMAAFFTYRSLLLNKIIKEAPLNFNASLKLMRYLMSSFVIGGIHFPEKAGPQKYVELVKDKNSITGDKLNATYILSEKEELLNKSREKKYFKMLKKLGIIPLKKVSLGHGSSIHYAGTLPFNEDENELFTINRKGKLNGTKNIYVSDGSGFKYLPAKGISFTLMAFAHYVAENAIADD